MRNILKVSIITITLFVCACNKQKPQSYTNSIMGISPYQYKGTWVFDDSSTGLKREPFVSGIPEMINYLIKDIPNADKGFQMLFSSKPFPGYMMKVTWVRKEQGGNWYYCRELDMEGWLCPALFKYFKEAPKEIYVKAERK